MKPMHQYFKLISSDNYNVQSGLKTGPQEETKYCFLFFCNILEQKLISIFQVKKINKIYGTNDLGYFCNQYLGIL